MPDCFVAKTNARTLPLTPIAKDDLQAWLKRQPGGIAAWVREAGFDAAPGTVILLPCLDEGKGSKGLGGALLGVSGADDIWSWGAASSKLPEGRFRIDPEPPSATATRAALGWALGTYAFTRYRKRPAKTPQLVWPAEADRAAVEQTADSVFLVRDLVNTPASDMGPGELAAAAVKLARDFKGKCRVILGDDLLRENYPAIHAVGRASSRAPRLIDLVWGKARAPKVTLVGKGVCFDTGGLDLKPAGGMKLMKKDMGGAAHALGLARMIMAAGLPVRLRVLIPAVENSVSGDAFRPLDVLQSRKGTTIEIGNTDAEGRLVLADALTEAVSEKPALLLDFATLTGAARVALGPDLPAMFCNDDELAAAFEQTAREEDDPLWRLPLWQPYRRFLDSKAADINNAGDTPFAGSITAALFLREFVGTDVPWAHFDLYAWNPTVRPGRPEGGDAFVIRAAFALIAKRFV